MAAVVQQALPSRLPTVAWCDDTAALHCKSDGEFLNYQNQQSTWDEMLKWIISQCTFNVSDSGLSNVVYKIGNHFLKAGLPISLVLGMPGVGTSEPQFSYQVINASEQKATWEKYLFNRVADTGVDALSETMELVFDAIEASGPASINLIGIAADSANAEHLASILRLTAPFKDQIPGWDNALNEASVALTKGGLDPHDALFGLI